MTSEEWVARINRVLDTVRDDLASPSMLADLSERAHSSAHHFHRRFTDLTGETPTQYVRRSRVERAAYLMMAAPERSLTEIGHDVGFNDQSDFSRVFRELYGVAPSKWDRRPGSLAGRGADAPPVRIITRPPMRLAVIRMRGIFGIDDLSGGYRELTDWMSHKGIDLDRSALVGMSSDNYRTTPPHRVHYAFGFTVPDEIEASGTVHIRELPAFSAAAVSIDGGLRSMGEAWDELYDVWFPGRPWIPSSLPAMKLFRRRPDQLGWDHFDLDCAVGLTRPGT